MIPVDRASESGVQSGQFSWDITVVYRMQGHVYDAEYEVVNGGRRRFDCRRARWVPKDEGM